MTVIVSILCFSCCHLVALNPDIFRLASVAISQIQFSIRLLPKHSPKRSYNKSTIRSSFSTPEKKHRHKNGKSLYDPRATTLSPRAQKGNEVFSRLYESGLKHLEKRERMSQAAAIIQDPECTFQPNISKQLAKKEESDSWDLDESSDTNQEKQSKISKNATAKPKLSRRLRINAREMKEKHERGLYGNYYKSPKNNII